MHRVSTISHNAVLFVASIMMFYPGDREYGSRTAQVQKPVDKARAKTRLASPRGAPETWLRCVVAGWAAMH